jgi:hypothetical protein
VADFQHYDFLAPFVVSYRSLAFIAKSAAKVLLFCELTKYFEKFFSVFLHFPCKSLIISCGNFAAGRHCLWDALKGYGIWGVIVQ